MRTTLTLDDNLFADLMRFTQAKTRTEAVNNALADWVRRKRLDALRGLRGKLRIADDVDALREHDIAELEALDG